MNAALAIERFGVHVVDRGERKDVIVFPQSLVLQEHGIYTLEGDNLAGKSTIVKLLMGALPRRFESEKPSHVIVGEERVPIRRITDAYRHGLAAVFQDDHLISTMPVMDQILMRHATPTAVDLRTWALNLVRDIGAHDVAVIARYTGYKVSSLLKRRILQYERVMESAERLLAQYGPKYTGILTKYPAQLSGGAIAVAKLLNAQLTERLRVLLLDEAFAGVQADARHSIIEYLKEWAQRERVTILAISHDPDEILQWQPRQRFRINQGRIADVGPRQYARLERGVPQAIGAFPIYKAGDVQATDWLSHLSEPFWAIVDKEVEQTDPTQELLAAIRERWPQFGPASVTSIPGGEGTKDIDHYVEIVLRGADLFPQRTGTILIIGGGTTLNIGGFVASTLHRGRASHVLVPTTLMAMADVAVGSKTSINLLSAAGPRKHVIGTYANPAAVWIDPRFLQTLSPEQKRCGLSESLKHGLLHDADLYAEVTRLLAASSDPDRFSCFDVAWRTLLIKSSLLAVDPFEEGAAKSLLFGHTHAHCFETASELHISHGMAVYIGILVELCVTGSPEYPKVLAELSGAKVIDPQKLPKVDIAKLRVAYEYLTSGGHGTQIRVQTLSRIGQYQSNAVPEEMLRTVDAVLAAVQQVRADLGAAGAFITG